MNNSYYFEDEHQAEENRVATAFTVTINGGHWFQYFNGILWVPGLSLDDSTSSNYFYWVIKEILESVYPQKVLK